MHRSAEAGASIATAALPEQVVRSRPRGWPPVAAVAGFSFGAHFVWEFLHAPLYQGLAEGTHWDGIKCCLLATLGDVVIAVVAYGAGAAATRDAWWLGNSAESRRERQHPRGVIAYLAIGLVITVVVEMLSVDAWGRWAYGPSMPTLLGIGVSPLLQWIVVPLLVLWLARRHLGVPGRAALP